MRALHISNAGMMAPAIAYLPWSSTRVEGVLEDMQLSPLLAHEQNGLVPLEAAARFIFRLSELSGEPNFCHLAVTGFDPRSARSLAGIPLPETGTGLQMAEQLIKRLRGVTTSIRFFSQIRDGKFWICRSRKTTSVSDTWSMAQYNLAFILKAMRGINGHSLRPAALDLTLEKKPEALPEDYHDIPIRSGMPWSGLGFNLDDLVKRRPPSDDFKRWAPEPDFTHLDTATADNVTRCIFQLIRDGRTDDLAARVADGFGVSLRSYQRSLGSIGVTHSELRDRARLMKAMEELRNDRRSITSIALELGYAHAGDFTRFFRKQTGQTPSAFRHAT